MDGSTILRKLSHGPGEVLLAATGKAGLAASAAADAGHLRAGFDTPEHGSLSIVEFTSQEVAVTVRGAAGCLIVRTDGGYEWVAQGVRRLPLTSVVEANAIAGIPADVAEQVAFWGATGADPARLDGIWPAWVDQSIALDLHAFTDEGEGLADFLLQSAELDRRSTPPIVRRVVPPDDPPPARDGADSDEHDRLAASPLSDAPFDAVVPRQPLQQPDRRPARPPLPSSSEGDGPSLAPRGGPPLPGHTPVRPSLANREPPTPIAPDPSVPPPIADRPTRDQGLVSIAISAAIGAMLAVLVLVLLGWLLT